MRSSNLLRSRLWGPALLLSLGAGGTTLSLCAARSKPKQPVSAADESFTPSTQQLVVETGDSLWHICDHVTGKPWVWPRVWAMNPEITNPHWIYPGDVVRFVPSSELPPRRAELVASSIDLPQSSEAQADKQAQGPRVEVINTAPPPSKLKREKRHRVYDGFFFSHDDLKAQAKLTNALADKILLRPGDSVFITYPPKGLPKAGDRFMSMRTVRPVEHPVTHKPYGYITEVTGVMTVEAMEQNVARARLDTTVREVERGQYIMPLDPNLMLSVAATAAPKPVSGIVVAVEGEMVTVGEQRLVFIDKGSKDGLARGNQLAISSGGDPLTGTDDHFPDVDVATLLVVDAHDTSSTCLVVDSTREIWPGDPVHSVGDVR